MKQRSNEVTIKPKKKNKPLSRIILPLFPQTFKHCAYYVETIGELFAMSRGQVPFIATHFQPQFTLVAGTDRHQEISLEFRRGRSLCPTFDNIRRDRAGCTPELFHKLELLGRRECSCRTRNIESQLVRLSKDVEVFIRLNRHMEIFASIPILVITSLFHYFVTSLF
jgi:hypothetical protein